MPGPGRLRSLGKTRLLREAFDRLLPPERANAPARPENPNSGTWRQDGCQVIALELIDFADVALHPLSGFLREVRQRFRDALPDHATVFADFDRAWLAYEDARDGQQGFDIVAQRTAELRVHFEENYTALTECIRVVWILDTLEQLYSVPLEILAYLESADLDSEDLGHATYSWLLSFIQGAPKNTSLLLAGRPTPGRWVQDVEEIAPGGLRRQKVAEFSEEETALYLATLCEQLGRLPELADRARELREATDEEREIANLQRLTGGNPIRLALYIDLFLNADTMPASFRDPDSTAHLTEAEIVERRDKLENDLLDYLTSHLADPEPQVLNYLSVMRRGLDRQRLKVLWGTADDEAVDDAFVRLQRLSFIKVRAETLFLHDEFYSIYQRSQARLLSEEQAIERERQRDIFQRLIDYNQERAMSLVQEIAEIQGKLQALRDDPSIADLIHSTAYRELKNHFRILRAERRSVRVERVHYALYNNPTYGLNNLFFRVSGQAFLANEPDLDELLQSEVSAFFFGGNQNLNRVQTGLSEEEWRLLRFQVLLERVARWARRLILHTHRLEAQQLIASASEDHQQRIARYYEDLAPLYDHEDGAFLARLFQIEWEVIRNIAIIYDGKDPTTAVWQMQEVTARLQEALSRDIALWKGREDLRWRMRNILAECLHYRGFLHANLYEFKVAEGLYKEANQILERTGFKILQSDVLNNLARVLGERGSLRNALNLCEQALNVRERYGFDLLRALSRNTLALINTRNARPVSALEQATTALNILRQIDNRRGIGLALIQIAEARRRIWNLRADQIREDRLSRHRIDTKLLDVVNALLNEAEEIFTNLFRTDARLIEIHIERGSLYRDWADFFGREEAEAGYRRAEELYRKAADLAAENNFRYRQHYLSACVNLAWLYAQGKQFDETRAMIDQVYAFVPEQYRFRVEGPPDPEAPNVTNFRELGKLHALRAQKLLPKEDQFSLLREHIFAITAMQLFSPFSVYYLEVDKQNLTNFLADTFRTAAERHELKSLTNKIIADYHLDALRDPLNGLQAEQLILTMADQEDDLPPYLRD